MFSARTLPIVTAVMYAAIAMPEAQASLLSNGSFETVVVTAGNTCDGTFPWCIRSSASTPGWSQTGDGVDLIHNNYTQPAAVLLDASDGFQFIDMNQAGLLGGIEQVATVVAGTTYLLSLDTAAWAENARGGTIGYALRDGNTVLASDTFTDPTGGTWITRTLQATALSNQLTVAIYAVGSPAAGMGLDNVSLTPVPVPSAGWLLAAGLGALGARARKPFRRD